VITWVDPFDGHGYPDYSLTATLRWAKIPLLPSIELDPASFTPGHVVADDPVFPVFLTFLDEATDEVWIQIGAELSSQTRRLAACSCSVVPADG
jgi:hypothetical protein